MSCESSYESPPLTSEQSTDNTTDLAELNNVYQSIKPQSKNKINDEYGEEVVIYKELLTLFSPENFECGLSDKIKNKLKKAKRKEREEEGFIPDYVANNTTSYEKGIKLDGRGANVLVHYFSYQKKNNDESKPIISQDAPTQLNFSATDFIDNKKENYKSFYFTMDCAGFFSASAKAATEGGFLGIGKGEIAAEGESTINQSQSIIVMRVLIHSPLYAAYKGNSIFNVTKNMNQETKNAIYSKQIETLESIISAIPTTDRVDSNRIYLNSNYEAIITSNKGSSGYNGKGELNSNVQINFTAVQTSGGIQSSNSVSRKTEFSDYNTYILDRNVDVELEEITIKNVVDKITSLKSLIVEPTS